MKGLIRCAVITAAAALFAGCGGSQPPTGVPIVNNSQEVMHEQPSISSAPDELSAHPSSPTYKESGPLLYVTNFTADYNDVKVYRANAKDPSPVAVITDGLEFPFGDCIDGNGTLYVTNQGTGIGFISEYLAGKTKKSKIITKPRWPPKMYHLWPVENVPGVGGHLKVYHR